MLTQELLNNLYHYNPETGVLTHKTSRGGVKAGSVAGSIGCDKRVQMYIFGKNYKAHRVIWLMVTGSFPNNEIDHIDGNPSNNSWNNLRDVTHIVNQQNRKGATKANRTKLAGVTPNRNRFGAQIKIDGKRIWLGTYDTPEEAHAIYLKVKRIHHIGCTV
jgi:hypothetical protein